MINRILERLEELKDEPNCLHEHDDYYDGIREAISIVKNESKNNDWIPCSEQMPNKEADIEVLVTYLNIETNELAVDVECFFYGVWVRTLERNIKRIAWQPKPEPYKG